MPDTAGAWSIVGNLAPIVWLGSLGMCALLIRTLMPVFRSVALAVPTQRSSHSAPTPQWGGLAISAATLGATLMALLYSGANSYGVIWVVLAALLLVLLGAVDDLRNLGAGVKFAAQAAAVLLMLAAFPADFRLLPLLPSWIETLLLFFGALWFVNLVNFMDGIDWMMVAEVVPVTIGVAIIAALGTVPPAALILALALNGAMLGFAPFNRPVARLFMGDMGSLPIGLLLAWLLIVVAGAGYLAAAFLLPLYFLADTGTTLARRVLAGERLWVAHRTHFYQRARDNGFNTLEIVGRIFAVNVALVALAALSVVSRAQVSQWLAVLAGICLVGGLMIAFARPRH
jgi:UDP-N-acetylmuramyl pentapeptide phosphotransferase/UDP-N-acetylglucosamine-1-phosphate transferase